MLGCNSRIQLSNQRDTVLKYSTMNPTQPTRNKTFYLKKQNKIIIKKPKNKKTKVGEKSVSNLGT